MPSSNFGNVLLSATFVFGFANPGATSVVTGGWSIGIEAVFYCLFPLMIAFIQRSALAAIALAVGAILLTQIFVNTTLRGHTDFTAQLWSSYAQPAAFSGYFVAGVALGQLYLRCSRLKGRYESFVLAALAVIPFCFARPANDVGLLTGATGFMLMTCTILFVAAVIFMPEPRGVVRSACSWIGEMSYPIYLLHPIVYLFLITKIGLAAPYRILFTVVLTLVLSMAVSRLIEAPMRAYGRRLTHRQVGGSVSGTRL